MSSYSRGLRGLGLGFYDDQVESSAAQDTSVRRLASEGSSFRSGGIGSASIGESPQFYSPSSASTQRTNPSSLFSKLFQLHSYPSPTPMLSHSPAASSTSALDDDRARTPSSSDDRADESPIIGSYAPFATSGKNTNEVEASATERRWKPQTVVVDSTFSFPSTVRARSVRGRGYIDNLLQHDSVNRHQSLRVARDTSSRVVPALLLAKNNKDYALFTNPLSPDRQGFSPMQSSEIDPLHFFASSISQDGRTGMRSRSRLPSFDAAPSSTLPHATASPVNTSALQDHASLRSRQHHLQIPVPSLPLPAPSHSAPLYPHFNNDRRAFQSSSFDYVDLPVSTCQAYTFPRPRLIAVRRASFDCQHRRENMDVNGSRRDTADVPGVFASSRLLSEEDDSSIRGVLRANHESREERAKWERENRASRWRVKSREDGYFSDADASTSRSTTCRRNSGGDRNHRKFCTPARSGYQRDYNAHSGHSPPMPSSFDPLSSMIKRAVGRKSSLSSSADAFSDARMEERVSQDPLLDRRRSASDAKTDRRTKNSVRCLDARPSLDIVPYQPYMLQDTLPLNISRRATIASCRSRPQFLNSHQSPPHSSQNATSSLTMRYRDFLRSPTDTPTVHFDAAEAMIRRGSIVQEISYGSPQIHLRPAMSISQPHSCPIESTIQHEILEPYGYRQERSSSGSTLSSLSSSNLSAAKLSLELYRQLTEEEEDRNRLVFEQERRERDCRMVVASMENMKNQEQAAEEDRRRKEAGRRSTTSPHRTDPPNAPLPRLPSPFAAASNSNSYSNSTSPCTTIFGEGEELRRSPMMDSEDEEFLDPDFTFSLRNHLHPTLPAFDSTTTRRLYISPSDQDLPIFVTSPTLRIIRQHSIANAIESKSEGSVSESRESLVSDVDMDFDFDNLFFSPPLSTAFPQPYRPHTSSLSSTASIVQEYTSPTPCYDSHRRMCSTPYPVVPVPPLSTQSQSSPSPIRISTSDDRLSSIELDHTLSSVGADGTAQEVMESEAISMWRFDCESVTESWMTAQEHVLVDDEGSDEDGDEDTSARDYFMTRTR